MIDKIHYISQNPVDGTHLDAIAAVLKSGGKWIQLRIKHMDPDAILDFALRANALCIASGAKLIVNDYPDIALKAGAYGVHLGLLDMPIRQARALLSSEMIIGGTANTLEDVLQRVAEGANYIGLGPYRFTTTKENLSPVIGLEGYQAIMVQLREAGIHIPVIAIGGIVAGDIPDLLQAGVYGVAISGALTNQTDAAALLRNMRESIDLHSVHHF